MSPTRKNVLWMPHAAHFICGDRCRFHLATYVRGYIVSTIGEMWSERSSREIHAQVYDSKWLAKNWSLKGDAFDAAYFKRFGWETIGHDRTYETMVFKALKSKEKNTCCPYRIDSGKQMDFEGYKKPGNAYQGHLRMVEKYLLRKRGDSK